MIWHCFVALSSLTTPSLAAPSPPAPARPSAPQADAPLVQLVRDFVEAERQFDQARLAALVTADYAEVSPLGELDRHDAFLSFYAADKKRAVPVMTLSEPLVRRYGDAASIIARLSFEIPGPQGQPPRAVAVRVSFLAVRSGQDWKLASAHYTPERPKAPAPAPAKPQG